MIGSHVTAAEVSSLLAAQTATALTDVEPVVQRRATCPL